MFKKSISLGIVLSTLMACQSGSPAPSESTSAEKYSATAEFMRINCESCHSPTANPSTRLAPPFFAIRKHYLKEYPAQADFQAAMQAFLNKPEEEHALMMGAVEKFGLMPPIYVEEEQLNAITEYLFSVEQPHPQHEGGRKGRGARVKELALSTKKVLGKNLMGALKEGGKEHALPFCNERALILTDSMSQHLHHKIRRVSDKARNPLNQADSLELSILAEYAALIAEGQEPGPIVRETEFGSRGYFPITTNAMCLQCHGTLGKELDADFYPKIQNLYPQDKAIGYGAGELRGMWVVALDSL